MILRQQRLYCYMILVFAILQGAGCKGKTSTDTAPKGTDAVTGPVITPLSPDFDFGQVKQGAEVSHIYKIKNTGTKELVIEKTHGS